MRTSRLWRLAAACRPLVIVTLAAGTPIPARAADAALSGVVVDQSGQPVPRALVRVFAATGEESTKTFADDAGRFAVAAAPPDCRVEVSLTGFAAAHVACAEASRIVLQVAPIAETVIVSATRTDAPADQTGASVSTFTAADLERRREPLVADLLRSTPGAMVVRSGAPGAQTSLFVRGGESSYNKVLLDGIPLNEPGGTFDFSNVTTDDLERIEVVRGAQSALFGSDAMSSVVQLFTKRADARDPAPRATASFEGGTYDTVRGNASVSGAAGGLDYTAGVQRFTTDNRVPNNRFDNTTLSANVGLALGTTATLRFIGRGELERTGTPGQTLFERPDLDAFFGRHDGTFGVGFDEQVSTVFRQRAAYSLAVSNYQSTDLIADPPYTPRFGDRVAPFAFTDVPFDSRTRLQRHHASYQADWRLTSGATSAGDHRLTVLADWDGERATLEDRLAGTSTPASRDNVGASIEEQALWPRVFVTVGARVEHNASFGGAAVPRGSFVFVAHDGAGAIGETRLKTSAGLGIKEPTLLQSFSPSPFFLGNPNLQPERSRTVDAGVEQRFASDRARVEATWFDDRYRNLITLETTDPATFASQYFNVGLTRARGAELSAEVAPVRSVRARGGYTFLSSEVLESVASVSPFAVGQPLFRRPRHSGYLGVTWTWNALMADLSGVFIGEYVDSDFASLQPPLVANPGYTTWDVRVSYQVTRQLRLLVAIDNAANAQYMEPLGYQALGRAVRLGLRVHF